MTAGQVITNLLLIALVPVTVLTAYRQERATVRRGLAAGATAAALVVVALLVTRRNLTISPATMLVAVVIAEESAKFLTVGALLHNRRHRSPTPPGRPRTRPNPAGTVGWSVGAGFATAEHLLYATAAPQIILIRIAGAGFVHLLTARLYSGALAPVLTSTTPYSVRRRSTATSGPRLRRAAPAPRTLVITATGVAGILLHLGYNLLARRLDQISVLW